jgi:hypothetical protein
MDSQKVTAGSLIAIALALVVLAWSSVTGTGAPAPDELAARGGEQTKCFTEQGGAKIVGESGCTIELRSGALLDVQAGATAALTGGFVPPFSLSVNSGTATPLGVFNQTGLGQIASFRDAGTPVAVVNDGGQVVLSAPTALATGVPGLVIENAGVSKILQAQVAGVSVFGINAGGQVVHSYPTAAATSVPALVVNNSGIANSLEVRVATTPVFNVQANGAVVGNNAFMAPNSGTATPGLLVDQAGAGKVVQFSDSGVAVLSVNNGGQVAQFVPTAIATDVPAHLIFNTGVSNPFEVRNSGGTPVAAIAGNGAINGFADIDVGTWINYSAQSTFVVVASLPITPTGTYQPLSSAASVATDTTSAIADGGETGDLLILRNINASDTITVDGVGGNVECKADIVMGAGDTIGLIWNGADWNCLYVRDNS